MFGWFKEKPNPGKSKFMQVSICRTCGQSLTAYNYWSGWHNPDGASLCKHCGSTHIVNTIGYFEWDDYNINTFEMTGCRFIEKKD